MILENCFFSECSFVVRRDSTLQLSPVIGPARHRSYTIVNCACANRVLAGEKHMGLHLHLVGSFGKAVSPGG